MNISEIMSMVGKHVTEHPLEIPGSLDELIAGSKGDANESDFIELKPVDEDSIFDVVLLGSKKITPVENVGFSDWRGTDAYAWYKPRHYFPNDWGIRIRADGVLQVAHKIDNLLKKKTRTRQKYDDDDLKNFAFRILYWHEFYHFLNEVAISSMEIPQKFKEKFYHKQQTKQANVIMTNRNDQPFTLTSYDLEEALANSLSLKHNHVIKNELTEIFDTQPHGYMHFRSVRWRKKFFIGSSVLGITSTNDPRLENDLFLKTHSPYDSIYQSVLKDAAVKDVPLKIINNVPNDYKFRLFTPSREDKWVERKSYARDWKKLKKHSHGNNFKDVFRETEIKLRSGNEHEFQSLNPKLIRGRKDKLYEIRTVDGQYRIFFKKCSDGTFMQIGVDTKKHVEKEDLTKKYGRIEC